MFYFGSSYSNTSAQPLQGVDSTDINNLISIPFLPDPLVLDEGDKNISIKNIAQWKQKREWIKKQFQYWISGSIPPPPEIFHVKTLSKSLENGIKLRTMELYFGPGNNAKMTVELMIPSIRGRLPVFMTQWNHRGWAQVAVRRGYIGCVYAGADAKDDTKNYSEIYPDHDFATLMRRAWGASRVIDYLYTLAKVDTARIALTGHSRNGKQSLMAAAFDNRIKAVVSSSGGTGGESTFRFSDDRFTPGSFDEMLDNHPDWFINRLQGFIGKEQKLPVDQNSLMSLIAPRGLMLVSAITEYEGNPWGVEQSYKSVKQVYHFLHADSAIAILLRRGRHQHAKRDIERYIDFFDYTFGRSKTPPENKLYYDYSFEKWKQLSGEHIDPLDFLSVRKNPLRHSTEKKSISTQQDTIRKHICWLLGNVPAGVSGVSRFSFFLDGNKTYRDDYLSEVIGEPDLLDSIKVMKFGPYSPLGEDLWDTMYFPPGTVKQDSVADTLPLVIYLHNYDYAIGYRNYRASSIIRRFTQQGYAVLMFDFLGFGTRIQEARHFYDRYPHWSEMGEMVEDIRQIISDISQQMPFIDSNNIYLAGYSLGGTVALFAAALDQRVKGVAAVSAFSSLRYDNKGTEGIRNYSQLHGLIPRLGFFVGYENHIPVDFEDIMGCIAPRPLVIIAPEHDRNHSIEYVKRTMKIVSNTYAKLQVPEKIIFRYPNTYNHFTDDQQQEIAKWLFLQKKH